MKDERERFEAWISSPPFEMRTDRFPDNPDKVAWPGSYRDCRVDLAWHAWQAARNDRPNL